MPIWLGVQGEQVGLRMVAELADGWNYNAIFVSDEFTRKLDVLRRHADAVGRDMAQIEISAQMRVERADLPAVRTLATHLVAAGVLTWSCTSTHARVRAWWTWPRARSWRRSGMRPVGRQRADPGTRRVSGQPATIWTSSSLDGRMVR